ncbi:cytosolic purine 5'-nucleotidase [Eurytemora carolleeae]|uniref:cytosolic purine 5'-nucleotidase n=1 Tax=Eurytemora carolleeae TaxID=1294199 RepID=UPI000C75BA45|nr:cytosolic purine 5'-nucleotidase [Eurytemora carolleeae]|eukprot:XP_023324415.1 cytosolic purine 5'-nucleotidase-like [Eurytemora affinis]
MSQRNDKDDVPEFILENARSSEPVPQTDRIYANKVLNLGNIKCFGFDMDYTLCEYISPEYDELAFRVAKTHLVKMVGYPEGILNLEYNPGFPVRGLWFDKELGNLVKVDELGQILVCIHGFRKLERAEIRAKYPHEIQRNDKDRIFIMNTLFNLAETHLLASIIDFIDSEENIVHTENGWILSGGKGKKTLTFKALFQDCRETIDYVHMDSMELKKLTVADLPRYVKKNSCLLRMLRNIKDGGKKSFLLTNSDWWYTQIIMKYLLNDENSDEDEWMSWFDLVIVDGQKPRFFSSGTPLLRVDKKTLEKIPVDSVALDSNPGGLVYSGGDHTTFTNMLGVLEPEIIYCGDHLYADVVKCRKECDWRTLLVVPELVYEGTVIQNERNILKELHHLESILKEDVPELEDVRIKVSDCIQRFDTAFSESGSLFRSGSRLTYFGFQMLAWADLYTGSVANLGRYSLNQRFVPPPLVLPHEIIEPVHHIPS